MPDIGIITDSSACVPLQLREQYGIEIVPIEFSVGGRTYRDEVDMTPSEFYTSLPKWKGLPTTSHPSPGRYLETIKKAAGHSNKLLCITIGKKFSGMFDSAENAAAMARDTSPDITIDVIDSGTAAGAQGWVVLAAARAAAAGSSHEQVLEVARSMIPRVHLFAVIDTLKFLAKGGRVPQIVAFAGSLLQIKPVIHVLPAGGGASPVAKVRTKSRAVSVMLEEMKKIAGSAPLHVNIHHSNVPEEAEELRQRLEREFSLDEIYVTDFTPAMGVHTGPGTVGIAFYTGA